MLILPSLAVPGFLGWVTWQRLVTSCVGNTHIRFGISYLFSSRSFVVPSHPRPSRPGVAYQCSWSQPTPLASSLTPLSCRFDPGTLYCFPAIAGQCPYPFKHIYHPAFAPTRHPRASVLHSGLRYTKSASDSRDRHILPHNPSPYTLPPPPVMPIPTTPQRSRSSFLRSPRAKVRVRFTR